MKTPMIAAAFASLLLCAAPATAQTFAHLNIDIQGNVISLSGGERGSVRLPTSGVTIGKTSKTTIARRENACGLAIGPSPQPQETGVWTVEVTPVQVYASAVTFQLKWARARADGRENPVFSGDMRVTLHPGESLPVDSLAVSTQGKMPGEACDLKAVALRVSVNFWPRPEDDTRLVNTELWLVEKLADGSERSQALTLRGAFNESTPFYFEPVTVLGMSLQLFGTFTLTPVGNSYSLMMDTRYRPAATWERAGQGAAALQLDALQRELAAIRARGYSDTHPDVRRLLAAIEAAKNEVEAARVSALAAETRARVLRFQVLFGATGTRRVESLVNLTPGEVVEIQLPQPAVQSNVQGSAQRGLSIRIRARQVQ